MGHKKSKATIPEWAHRISALRKRLKFSQGELGRRLDCSAMTVSRWERGLMEPAAEHYLRIGTQVGSPDCWFFWERAGLRQADVARVFPGKHQSKLPVYSMPKPETAHAGTGERIEASSTAVVALPLLVATAASLGGQGDKRSSLENAPASRLIGAPRDWCPNPRYTSLIRVRGASMEPLIRDGDIVAVDSWQTDREVLHGKIVVVSNDDKGLCVSHFRHYSSLDILEPENREYSVVELQAHDGWRVVGRVLWWISQAP